MEKKNIWIVGIVVVVLVVICCCAILITSGVTYAIFMPQASSQSIEESTAPKESTPWESITLPTIAQQ